MFSRLVPTDQRRRARQSVLTFLGLRFEASGYALLAAPIWVDVPIAALAHSAAPPSLAMSPLRGILRQSIEQSRFFPT